MTNNKRLSLPNVTLCAMDSIRVRETIKALQYSMRDIEFGEVILITHRRPIILPRGIKYKHIDYLGDIDRFNVEIAYNLGDYIRTDYCLLVHYDGYVVNVDSWRNEYFDYDYIGSPWPLPNKEHLGTYTDVNGDVCRVGNSVSLRSSRLMKYPKEAGVKMAKKDGYYNEDVFLCCTIKHLLEEQGMKIAPIDVAKYFGHERMLQETEGIRPFVFHKWAGTNREYPDFRHKGIIGRIENKFKRVEKRVRALLRDSRNKVSNYCE